MNGNNTTTDLKTMYWVRDYDEMGHEHCIERWQNTKKWVLVSLDEVFDNVFIPMLKERGCACFQNQDGDFHEYKDDCEVKIYFEIDDIATISDFEYKEFTPINKENVGVWDFEDDVFKLFRKLKPEYITSDIEPNYDITCDTCDKRVFKTGIYNNFTFYIWNDDEWKKTYCLECFAHKTGPGSIYGICMQYDYKEKSISMSCPKEEEGPENSYIDNHSSCNNNGGLDLVLYDEKECNNMLSFMVDQRNDKKLSYECWYCEKPIYNLNDMYFNGGGVSGGLEPTNYYHNYCLDSYFEYRYENCY